MGCDSNNSTVIVDNSANAQICLKEDMFTDKIEPIIPNGLATIGEKDLIQNGIGTVRWSWTDDEGQLHLNNNNNLLYFPYSSFNKMSTTALDEFMKYDDGTWVITKRKYSIFT